MRRIVSQRGAWLACGLAALATAGRTVDAAPGDRPSGLVEREQDLLRQYRDLERSFLRLADLLAVTDPRRAALLRSVFEKARQEQVGDRLDTIVALLEKGQLLKAGTSQAGAIEQFRALLELLESGDTGRQLASTKQEVRQYLARLAKAIARQRDIEGSTEAGGREPELAERQRALAEETRTLAEDIQGFARRVDERAGTARPSSADRPPAAADGDGDRPEREPDAGGEPAAPPPDADAAAGAGQQADESPEPQGDDDAARARRTRRRLAAAERRMQSARERLEEARRQDARREQEKAVEELETARAELEEILRQMREQEVERMLVQLETRVREMLKAEREVVAAAAAVAGTTGRDREIESVRLGRAQQAIVVEATRALVLVRDDGTAVAIPQALESVRDDAEQAAGRLGRGDVGGTTRGLLDDVVTNLEELLAALEKSQRDEARRQAAAGGGRPQEPDEQPLVDKIAELKMIRSLQMRVNTRTRRFAQLLDEAADRVDAPELREALERLAERQRKIERAAQDIVAGRTEE